MAADLYAAVAALLASATVDEAAHHYYDRDVQQVLCCRICDYDDWEQFDIKDSGLGLAAVTPAAVAFLLSDACRGFNIPPFIDALCDLTVSAMCRAAARGGAVTDEVYKEATGRYNEVWCVIQPLLPSLPLEALEPLLARLPRFPLNRSMIERTI